MLFGSILMYSLANIANGFVGSVSAYAALRLIAGIGLAGELGAGITLVSEIMQKERRGFGTTIVASVVKSTAILRRRSQHGAIEQDHMMLSPPGRSAALCGGFESKRGAVPRIAYGW